jgi:hypothetical protein
MHNKQGHLYHATRMAFASGACLAAVVMSGIINADLATRAVAAVHHSEYLSRVATAMLYAPASKRV